MRKTLLVLSIRVIILAMLAGAAFGLALAQDALPEPSFDPATWFASTAALAAVIVAAVAFIKRNILKSMTGVMTVAFSFALGIGIAVVGSFTSFYDASIVEALAFGAGAALLASGGWDAIVGVLGKR